MFVTRKKKKKKRMNTCQVFHMLMQLKALCMLCSTLVQTFYMLLVWLVGL